MADKKISQLPAATTPLAGTEVLPIVQSGTTVKVSVDNLTAGKPVSCSSLTVNAGNLVIGTSGKGIDFSATANGSGTMTSELLADYEEGTWTPTIGGTATYWQQTGRYTKIGRTVHIEFVLEIRVLGTGSTSAISGLPFTSGAMASGVVSVFQFLAVNQSTVTLGLASSATTITCYGTPTPAASVSTAAIFQNGAYIAGTIVYSV